ncbi:MAG: translation elongation factor Ts [Alphaproteobacteria bacterium]|jgi:elongation factor Ts|uniref:translation elongation factor Ts n=1 Tax=Devosia sp. XGJD_8 TaxID=3391187 RepID=UPI001DC9FB94|nr:translation elongation factor Ts [Alphaproteobacteria bacterium]MBU1560984.1 translation elongation factor Ts [Alphaproteobacteria bacterium]MBU2304958.1 translation elongation factor Ts [Alphaproteobacteria bacterium]MBU2370209.1 translation elongation factor Ts [Alphaproteobacteria bacterium]
MEITAGMVKQLRDSTGVGMMDCKKALAETNGDMEAAVDWLRTRGLAKAAKKADRVAAEGLVGVATAGTKAAVVEVNSETDFVARNEQFQAIVANVAKLALDADGDVVKLGEMPFPGSGHSVSAELTEAIAKIGENMNLRRTQTVSVSDGVVESYVHNAVKAGLGRMGILVALESTGDKTALSALGKQLAMHIAATNPLSIDPEDLDQDVVARERAIILEQVKESGKSAEIAEKMVDGRMRKYFEEVTLLAQTFVIDGETKVRDAIKNAEKDVGAPIKLTKFVRFALGEGIEKVETDFAAEVAATAGVK